MSLNINRHKIQFLLILSFTCLLSACGFQLREQTQVIPALKSLNLSLSHGSLDFNRDLRIALVQAGISIVDIASSDELLELKTNPISATDMVMARADDNDITQVERRLSVTYFIRDKNGQALWGPRIISTSVMLSNQDAEQSVKAAYNAEQMRRAGQQLANELVYDLSFASF